MIVNPWFFYVLQLTGNLRGMLVVIGGLAMAIGIMLFIENDIVHKSYKVKPWIIGSVICFAFVAIFPSEKTLLLMKASEFVTYDNVNLTVDTFKSAIDYAATLF